jgi:hypothetical protein
MVTALLGNDGSLAWQTAIAARAAIPIAAYFIKYLSLMAVSSM